MNPPAANSTSADRYLRALFESLPVAVLVADDDGRYVDANAAACALLHRERNQIVGHSFAELLTPRPDREIDAQWKSFMRDGRQSGFVDITLPEGGQRTVRFQAYANFVPGLHCSFLSQLRGEGTEAEDETEALTMCAWTRRVHYNGKWMNFEDYLLAAHGQRVSHGIAPDAFDALDPDALDLGGDGRGFGGDGRD